MCESQDKMLSAKQKSEEAAYLSWEQQLENDQGRFLASKISILALHQAFLFEAL